MRAVYDDGFESWEFHVHKAEIRIKRAINFGIYTDGYGFGFYVLASMGTNGHYCSGTSPLVYSKCNAGL